MKKILFAMSLFLGALLMTACGSKNDKDENLEPEEVVEKFLQAWVDEDADALLECIDSNSKKAARRQIEKNDGLKEFRVTKSYDEDDEVYVKAKMWYNNGKEEIRSFRLKEKGGKWVIAN